ncbi:MAG TPA: DUF4230 domain-containing protein, partial [Chloroflexia bacterium]|nr:DUF4230 domain-containing protein [Chloroflexia bacterium]
SYKHTTNYPSQPSGRSAGPLPGRNTGNACIWLLALAAVVVLACGLLGAGVLKNGVGGLSGWIPGFPNPFSLTPTVVIQSGPSVVQQIQGLSRLETARYTLDKVVTAESSNGGIPFTGDKILFVARGDVIAGVDLGKLRDSDVQVVSNTVTIRLPAAEIFSSRLDNAKSRVYDRQTGFFSQGNPNLETQVRQEAEQGITTDALESGILTTAQTNAEKSIRALLHSLRYDQVTFLDPAPTPAPTLVAPDMTPTP